MGFDRRRLGRRRAYPAFALAATLVACMALATPRAGAFTYITTWGSTGAGNGEFSVLAHMKQGSVTVKAGDRVKRGQKIGELGASGDSMFPHLHYQLQRDAKTGEGLPSYFRDFRRLTGKSWVRVKRGHVDTGDVVESAR